MNFNKNLTILCLLLCAGSMFAKDIKVSIQPDTTTVLRNPLSGWVMYLGRTWDENFWTHKGYDSMSVENGKSTVRVSDFASTCYLRTSWSSLEPEEGIYIWNNPDSRLYKLLNSCLSRGMKLAFRIVVDSRDQGQNTPLYVKEAGAKGFQDPNNPRLWSPYPDDSVFQQKYAQFLEAFASHYNDPEKVDFIDAFGLGKWGEAHGLIYHNYKNKEQVFNWITDLYTRLFTHIPLVINYHRLVADTISWDSPHPDSRRLLENAISKGYSIRHDAFGMTGYYQEWEKEFADKWQFRRPIIMEGGWITGGHHRYWIDPSNTYRMGHSEDVRRGEYELSRETHVNMMDLRVGDETRSWFNNCFNLVKAFIREGGYRLYPFSIIATDKAKANATLHIQHGWRNIGWGYCPTNIPQWNQKYKVGIALMDPSGKIVKTVVESHSDLSVWIKGTDHRYETAFSLQGIKKGNYTWLIGLVDTTKGNLPGIQMAVAPESLCQGWMVFGKLRVN